MSYLSDRMLRTKYNDSFHLLPGPDSRTEEKVSRPSGLATPAAAWEEEGGLWVSGVGSLSESKRCPAGVLLAEPEAEETEVLKVSMTESQR